MIALSAARVLVDGATRSDAWVTVDGERIAAVSASSPAGAEAVHLGDVDLIPGLIDLHCDCLEVKARPRPTSELPLASAMNDLDAEVAAHGITTNYLCVTLDDEVGRNRTPERARETLDWLDRHADGLRVDHRVHLRVETSAPCVPLVDELAATPVVALVSYMTHLPGVGQYADEAKWHAAYVPGAGGATAVEETVRRRLALAGSAEASRERIARAARAGATVLASHDDDDEASVARAGRLGVGIAEFPVTMTAARAARAAGIGVLMGAPNARRGASHVGNLSARDALAAGVLHALSSDYHPPSLLAAAYELPTAGCCDWPRAIGLITDGPARLAGLDDRGRIAPGLRADLVAVARRPAGPGVAQVWRAGTPLWSA